MIDMYFGKWMKSFREKFVGDSDTKKAETPCE